MTFKPTPGLDRFVWNSLPLDRPVQSIATRVLKGGKNSGRYPKGSGVQAEHNEKPRLDVAAMEEMRLAMGEGHTHEAYVGDYPLAIRAAPVVTSLLKEMKDKGYLMPDGVEVSLTIAGTTPHGLTKRIGGLEPHVRVEILLPETIPPEMDLDEVASKAFGGKTGDVVHQDAAGKVISTEPGVDRFAVKTFRDIALHEMGHVQASVRDYGSGDLRSWQTLSFSADPRWNPEKKVYPWPADPNEAQLWMKRAARSVSDYAARNENEFLAEAFTRMYRGETLTPEAAQLYKAMEGPAIL